MTTEQWHPSKFLRFIDSLDTSRKVTLIETDAGEAYVKAMFASEIHHPLACEYLGTQLARLFGLPTLDFAIMPVGECDRIPLGKDRAEYALPGPAFVTKSLRGNPWSGSARELKKIENAEVVSRLVVFDTWTRNWDRCPPAGDARKPNYDNVFLTSEHVSPKSLRLIPIDHSECFSGGRDLSTAIGHISAIKDVRVFGLFDVFKQYLDRQAIAQAESDLKMIDPHEVRDCVAAIPWEWDISTPVRAALTEFICSRARFLADNILMILTSSRYMDRLI